MTYSRCTYDVSADLDTSCIRPFTTQSQWLPIRWRCAYDDDNPDMIWAAPGTLMQTSLRSEYDLISDISPDRINKCTDHCRSLVPAHRYHGYSIRCPAFGSNSETACHFRVTDCPGTTIPMEERRQLNWSHWLSAKEIKQTVIRTDKTDRIVSRIVWNILSWIDRIKREYMDGWNRFLKRCSSNIEGSSPLPESWAKIYSTPMGSLTSTFPLLEREQSESGLIWVGESGSTV